MKITKILKDHANFPDMVRHVILSWLIAVTVEYYMLPQSLRDLAQLDGLAQMSLGRIAFMTLFVTVDMFIISCVMEIGRIERWGIAGVFSLLALGTLGASMTVAYLVVCLLLLAALVIFGWRGWKTSEIRKSIEKKSGYLWVTLGISVAFFLFVSIWTVSRVYCFATPSFDFGLFSQMFYHMKETGLPMTTLERDGLLSHFAVHVSPIYYLMLPFYWLFPTPATLQVLQALVLTSAVIPLWKIGEHHGLSGAQRMMVCIVLLLYPAFSGGTGYDLHENCFLTPLILWTLYGVDKQNWVITAIAGVLTLTVKEDAAVYVAVIALWLLMKTMLQSPKPDRNNLLTGVIMLAVSLGWFLITTAFLRTYGDGVMTGRYDNLMYDGSSSLITVVKSVVLNPMKAIYECVDNEKLAYIAATLLPLLGLPLITRRYERYILLIPYLLVNLMSDYQYQHDVFFQYSFGSTALLLYLTVINLADFKVHRKRVAVLSAALLVTVVYFCALIVPTGIRYPIQTVRYHGYYENIRHTLDKIPEGASVAATTYYSTYLSQRDTVYDVRYCSRAHLLQSEYVVLDRNSASEYQQYAADGGNQGYDNLIDLLEAAGYREYAAWERVLVIYQKGN